MSKIKFSLATNFSSDFVEGIKKFSDIYEVYGRMKDDVFCAGRPNNSTKDITRDIFEDHVNQIRKQNINFNYLLNGACYGNKEQNHDWQKKCIDYIGYLVDIGVNAVTITNPLILILVKKYFPDLICRVSTFCCVDTVRKATFWEDMGADIICLDFVKVNRNFELLREIKNSLKSAKVELLATNSCIKDCPYIHTHVNNIAHASDGGNDQKYIDWCLHKCQFYELKHPEEYIRSPWIRPEDLHYYEDIGIEHIKLTERDFPTEILIKRLSAYHNRAYDGNLLDLIQGHGWTLQNSMSEKLQRKTSFADVHEVLNEIFRVRGFNVERKQPAHVFIDNKKLGDFLKFFVDGSCKNNCDKCKYCENISASVITKNEEISNYLEELYKLYEQKLI